MKKNNFEKLKLRKQIVANLGKTEMSGAIGGAQSGPCTGIFTANCTLHCIQQSRNICFIDPPPTRICPEP